MGEVCVLPVRFISSSKGNCLLSLYIILPSFIKIGRELFELIDIKNHTHTDRHIHADENNTCPKTKFLGQVITASSLSNDTSCTAFSGAPDGANFEALAGTSTSPLFKDNSASFEAFPSTNFTNLSCDGNMSSSPNNLPRQYPIGNLSEPTNTITAGSSPPIIDASNSAFSVAWILSRPNNAKSRYSHESSCTYQVEKNIEGKSDGLTSPEILSGDSSNGQTDRPLSAPSCMSSNSPMIDFGKLIFVLMLNKVICNECIKNDCDYVFITWP